MRTFVESGGEQFNLADICEPELLCSVVRLFDRFYSRCESVEFGRNRLVFLMGRYVVKVPMSCAGIADNDWEGSVKSTDESYVKLARTRLYYGGDLPVVFMERVNYSNLPTNTPDWVYSVDCCQVGFNRHGNLVAFDFGLTQLSA